MSKLRYVSRGGAVLEGSSALDIVMALRDAGLFTSKEGLDTYMLGVAEREKAYSGQIIDLGSVDAFISSAVASGLLVPIY